MVKIYRGDETCILNHFKRIRIGLPVVLLAPEQRMSGVPSNPVPWAGCRSLLGALESLEPEAFCLLVQRHRIAFSMLYPGVRSGLSEAENITYRQVVGTLHSNLSHNYFIHQLFIDLWYDVFEDIYETFNFALALPEVTRVDGPTLALLKNFISRRAELDVPIFVGHDPAGTPVTKYDEKGEPILHTDENGLLWGHTDLGVQSFLFALRSIPNTEMMPEDHTLWVSAGPENLPTVLSVRYGTLDDDFGWQDRLSGEGSVPSDREIAEVLQCMRSAFTLYDFDCALALGVWLLSVSDRIAEDALGEVYHTAGLSAHNRQFESFMGHPGTNKFLHDCFTSALSCEITETATGYLYYRLAVVHGRRNKDFLTGMGWANKLADFCAAKSNGEWNLLYAWCLNIRAYLHANLKNKQAARKDIQLAFSLIKQDAAQALPEERELIFTASLVADNAATLADLSGDLAQGKIWLHESDHIIGKHGGNNLYAPKAWIKVHNRMTRPDLSLKAARVGLEGARQHRHPFLKDLYLINIGEAYFRMGAYEMAETFYLRALRVQKKYKDGVRQRVTYELLLSNALAAGAQLSAVKYYDALAAEKGDGLLTASLAVYALQLGGKLADQQLLDRMNDAIRAVAEQGVPEQITHLNLLLARICSGKGYREWSEEAENNAAATLKVLSPKSESYDYLWASYYLLRVGATKTKDNKDQVRAMVHHLSKALRRTRLAWLLLSELGDAMRSSGAARTVLSIHEKTMAGSLLSALRLRVDLSAVYSAIISNHPEVEKRAVGYQTKTDGTIGRDRAQRENQSLVA